jgi:predicted DNA-binding protein
MNPQPPHSAQGRQSSDLLREVWEKYVENHRDELAADMEEAAKLLREGDTITLAKRFG